MARETKIIQCRPSDETKEINYYQRFGWEVIGNQRCQEEEKRGNDWYIVTFNKITFSREKSTPWYARVCELEQETEDLLEYGVDAINGDEYGIFAPSKPKVVNQPKIARKRGFFTGLIITIIALILEFSIKNIAIRDIMPVFIFIGMIMLLTNIKNLKGLSGEKAQNAIKEYNEYTKAYAAYNKEYDEYLEKLQAIVDKKLKEISEELNTLIV